MKSALNFVQRHIHTKKWYINLSRETEEGEYTLSHNVIFLHKRFAHRPHSASSCYQTGYMAKGNPNLVESKACPKGPPKGGVWFPVSVKVHGQNVQVYLSGDLVATVKSHFAPRARGGVLTFNGYKNVILFRKFQIAPQMYSSKRCGKVVEIPDRAKLLKLVADHGAWPQDSFCQVIYLKDAGKSRNYQLSVDLFNFIGQGKANYGHPGVFFNAEDEDNYDFVYFRFGKFDVERNFSPSRGSIILWKSGGFSHF